MAKIPDFSELSKKINLQGILDNVKNVLETKGTSAHPPLQSELLDKCKLIQEMMQNTLQTQAAVNDQINEVKHKIAELARDIQSYETARLNPVVPTEEASTPTSKDTTEPKE